MTYTLNFTSFHEYELGKQGVTVPVELRLGDVAVSLVAKLDTGASFCIFNRTYGESLGLDIEHGHPEWVDTAAGHRFLTYGHNITLITLDYEFDTMVYFAADEGFRRNV